MRKRITGVALVAATTVLAFHPMYLQKEVTNPNIGLQQDEIPIGTSSKSEESVNPTEQVPVTLVNTIDGDTIKVKVKGKIETVRYLLIDTPESKKPNMCVQPYAKEAYFRNDQLVRSGTLTMEMEPGNSRDAYGRLVAYVYADGKSVQETLLKEGFARVGYIMNPPYKYLNLYREDESLAKTSKLNIWSKPHFVTQWGFNGCVP